MISVRPGGPDSTLLVLKSGRPCPRGARRAGRDRTNGDGEQVAPRRTPLGDRLRYWFDSTLARGAPALGGWLALLCLAVVVPASAAVVWTDPDAPASLTGRLSQVWRLTGETLRLGGVTGAPLRVALSVLLALVALLYVSTLVGLITTALTERLIALRRGRSTVLERGHAVVLGWSEQVFTVVGELVAANANRRGAALALLADRDKTVMEEALNTKLGPSGRTRLICRSGPTTDPAVLALTNPAEAGVVLVLPHDEPDADAQVVKTLLAFRAALPDRDTGPPVIAALRDDRYRLAASLAAGPPRHRPGERHRHRRPDRAGRPPPRTLPRPPRTARLRRGRVLPDRRTVPGRTYVRRRAAGLHRFERRRTRTRPHPLLSPPPDTPIGPDDQLVVISRDDDTARPDDCSHHVEETAMASEQPPPHRPSGCCCSAGTGGRPSSSSNSAAAPDPARPSTWSPRTARSHSSRSMTPTGKPAPVSP
ncbi:hypothetical protein GCM10020295_79000 [Streptomyces cinereospinus]